MNVHQVPAAWSERGYVPPEKLDVNDNEDEKGEAAYMRCFHESSKIGRVPNASYFVNSPTARAYIEKRDKELFPVKEASSKLIPNPDMPSWPTRKEGPRNHYPSISESSVASSNVQPPPLSKSVPMPSSEDFQPTTEHNPLPQLTPVDQPHIPWSIEPRTEASGPPKMLR
jgi:hypothetical protein